MDKDGTSHDSRDRSPARLPLVNRSGSWCSRGVFSLVMRVRSAAERSEPAGHCLRILSCTAAATADTADTAPDAADEADRGGRSAAQSSYTRRPRTDEGEREGRAEAASNSLTVPAAAIDAGREAAGNEAAQQRSEGCFECQSSCRHWVNAPSITPSFFSPALTFTAPTSSHPYLPYHWPHQLAQRRHHSPPPPFPHLTFRHHPPPPYSPPPTPSPFPP